MEPEDHELNLRNLDCVFCPFDDPLCAACCCCAEEEEAWGAGGDSMRRGEIPLEPSWVMWLDGGRYCDDAASLGGLPLLLREEEEEEAPVRIP